MPHGREGGEQRADDLLDTLKQCVDRLGHYRSLERRVGEQNTKAGLIEPVIAALGWDVLDPEEVHREYRRRTTDSPIDYALILMRMPRLFIEAEAVGENLDDPRWANQTISYAAVAGVDWVALTNGAEWCVWGNGGATAHRNRVGLWPDPLPGKGLPLALGCRTSGQAPCQRPQYP
ncbi:MULTISPECIES: hypothetical protein [unclassified Streptomyces]|uniref:hypothetical protein n=1 Tax=unclassified Streptomyces TaxID=2593676 RepID=UPI0036EEA2F9